MVLVTCDTSSITLSPVSDPIKSKVLLIFAVSPKGEAQPAADPKKLYALVKMDVAGATGSGA